MGLNKTNSKELLKFIVGGTSAVLTDYLVYSLMVHWEIIIAEAKLISFVLGSIVGFIINKIWTFDSKRFSIWEIVRYAVLYGITAYLNVVVNALVLHIANIQLLAFFCATGTSTVLNFIGQKFFVFRVKRRTKI